MDLEEQYDKVYRYCYSKVRQRELAEDITQEAFLRLLESSHYVNTGKSLQYLYTIARNLCIDEYRRKKTVPIEQEAADTGADDHMTAQISVRIALARLSEEEKEILLLRYANDVPVSVIGEVFGISRFAVYRKLLQAVKHFKAAFGEEDIL